MIIRTLVELVLRIVIVLRSKLLRTTARRRRRWDGFGSVPLSIWNDRVVYHYFVTLRGLPLDLFNEIMRIVNWPRALTNPRNTHGWQDRGRTATRKERRKDLVTQKEVRKGLIPDRDGTLIAFRRTPAIGARTRIIAAQRLGDLSLLGTGDLPHIPTPESYIA